MNGDGTDQLFQVSHGMAISHWPINLTLTQNLLTYTLSKNPQVPYQGPTQPLPQLPDEPLTLGYHLKTDHSLYSRREDQGCFPHRRAGFTRSCSVVGCGAISSSG
jgi:hypothetical protein